MRSNFKSIDQYIKSFPDDVQPILQKLRKTIKSVVPKEEETISYQIPTFKMNGKYVVYFAGFAKHISLYPFFPDTTELKRAVKPYMSGKATLKFPLDKPLPYPLIKKVVKILAKKNQERTKK